MLLLLLLSLLVVPSLLSSFSPLLASPEGATNVVDEDDGSPLMPFSAKIGDGWNDREDAPGRERHKITKTKVVTVHTSDVDFRIIVADIGFVLGEKQEGCGCCEAEGESMVNDDKVIILMLLLERSVLDFGF